MSNTPTEVRKQLLHNGYTPVPNRGKACYLKGWPRVDPNAETLAKWARMSRFPSTGVRVEDGLCVVDIDIDHRVIDDVIEVMLAAVPESLRPERLERAGKGHKVAWFVQCDEPFTRLHTRRWTAPGEGADDATHSIEIFGGGSPRQFGAFGGHTLATDGAVEIDYVWADESLLDVPLHDLPEITKAQLFAMLDACERELKVQGFEPVARTERGEGSPGRVYDLTEDMVFDLDDGASVSLAELADKVKGGWSGRCSASWLEGANAKNRQRCLVSASHGGFVSIWESAAGVTHMPAAVAPTSYDEVVNRAAERIAERKVKRRSKLNADDNHISGAAKLLLSHAFIPTSNRPVLPLWSAGDEGQGMSLTNFRTACAPYCGIETGPQGGEKRINPVDVWLSNPSRINAAGVQMRPAKARPTFEDEQGRIWVNSYAPPDLGPAEGGTLDMAWDYFSNLLPDEREREWFFDWLAYKWQNPHIPGPSVIMVARSFGSGRGTLGRLLGALFGSRYVADVSFKHFTGQTYQSQYTDWGKNALFAIVNESSAAGERSPYQIKHDVYEHLKEVVDPAPREVLYVTKGEQSARGVSSTTNLIMTNNPDAIPLPRDDRRFAVLTNGDKQPVEFWDDVRGWMGQKCNIAALGVWLGARDTGDYSPFAVPIMTNAKRDMAQMNMSVLDEVFEDALDTMEGVFVPEQMLRRMAEIEARERRGLPEKWRPAAAKRVAQLCYPVRYPNGGKLRPSVGGKRYYLYAKTARYAGRFDTNGDVRGALLRNGNVFDGDASRLSKIAARSGKNKT